MCLAKANGISYKDLQEMIAGAKGCNATKVNGFNKERVRDFGKRYGDIRVYYNGIGNTGVEGYLYLYGFEYVVLENYKPYKITLSEFWAEKELLAIHCETEEQVKRLCETMLKRNFKNKGKNEVIYRSAKYVFNDKRCLCVAINQANGALDAKAVFNFDEVDLEH